ELFGFTSKEDFINTHPSNFSPPTQPDGKDSFSASLEHIKTAIAKGIDFFAWVHKKADGTLFPAEVKLSRLPLGEGVVVQALVRDITERKQAEELFRSLAANSPVGVYIVQKGKFVYINQQFQRDIGYREDELLGMEAQSLVIPEDRETVRNNAIQMLKEKRIVPYEFRAIDKNGKIKWALESIASIQHQGNQAIIGSYQDITERKRAEEESKKYQTLFETSNDAIMMLDRDGKFFDGNKAAFELFGFTSKEDFIQIPPSELSPPTQPDGKDSFSASLEHIETALVKGSDSFEWVHKKKDRTLFSAEVRLSSLLLGEKTVLQALVRDITERRQAEEEREKLILELRASLEKVKTLGGLLPICAACKKIRDDKGYWNQIDSYIRDHSEAEFTHGICPECMKKLYPDFEIVE
ncbi:MAG TPA: PAS domain S-box protein, partial [Thermodesulfobacteriota bacterium]|nr:PAS domain S-box protein [Thermodesulfobacteriota bacterium]